MLLVAAAITDLSRGKIYNALVYPVIVLAILLHTLLGGIRGEPHGPGSPGDIGLIGSLGGFAVGFLPLMLLAFSGGINGGDVKLVGAVGALMGWEFVLQTLLYSFLTAALLAVVLILYKRVFWRTLKRMGLFALQVVSMHKPIDPASADSPKVPFGLAICVGAVAAIVQGVVFNSGLLTMLGA